MLDTNRCIPWVVILAVAKKPSSVVQNYMANLVTPINIAIYGDIQQTHIENGAFSLESKRVDVVFQLSSV